MLSFLEIDLQLFLIKNSWTNEKFAVKYLIIKPLLHRSATDKADTGLHIAKR